MKERCKLVACIKCNRRKESRKGDLGFRDYAMKCMQRNQVRGVVDKKIIIIIIIIIRERE
jgi:hypothetical protein